MGGHQDLLSDYHEAGTGAVTYSDRVRRPVHRESAPSAESASLAGLSCVDHAVRRSASSAHSARGMTGCEVLAASLYDDPAAELLEDASARLGEHLPLPGCRSCAWLGSGRRQGRGAGRGERLAQDAQQFRDRGTEFAGQGTALM